jgi:hypothetical protein
MVVIMKSIQLILETIPSTFGSRYLRTPNEFVIDHYQEIIDKFNDVSILLNCTTHLKENKDRFCLLLSLLLHHHVCLFQDLFIFGLMSVISQIE